MANKLNDMDWRVMCASRAAGCEGKAAQTQKPEISAIYITLAEQWRELVEHPQPRSEDAELS